MNVWRLVRKEIGFRRLDFLLGVVAVVAAVGCLVAVMTLLRAHDSRVVALNEAKAEQVAALMALNEDDYRKIMKKMGYNLVILHRDEDRSDFFSKGYATEHMPYEFVTRLCNSRIMTVQHLLPTLYRQTAWPEFDDCPINLMGVRGEVPHLHSNKGATMMHPVDKGAMRIGFVLQQKLGIKTGDTVTLMDKPFTVAEVHEERGSVDDISVWIHLEEAQELLDRQDQVNAVLALSCFCAGAELEKVRKEIAGIVPEAQVIRRASEADIRALSRGRAKELTAAAEESEADYHARLSGEREAFASWLVPLVVVGATIWIGLLALGNVRERRVEIGILRALGLRSRQILCVFLARAILMGFIGALIGFAVGLGAGAAWGASEGIPLTAQNAAALFDPLLLACVLFFAPLQACLASWIPAILATQHDPAVVLCKE